LPKASAKKLKPAVQIPTQRAPQENPIAHNAPSTPLISPQKALEQVAIPAEVLPIAPTMQTQPCLEKTSHAGLIDGKTALAGAACCAALAIVGYFWAKGMPEYHLQYIICIPMGFHGHKILVNLVKHLVMDLNLKS